MNPARPPDIVARLERAALNAVPAPRVAWDGPFVVRGFLGGTGRANAACSLDPSPDPELGSRVARIEAHYARLRLPARFRSTPLDPPGLVPLLKARGYREAEGAVVMLGTVPAEVPSGDADGVAWSDAPTEDWLSVLATAEYQGPARRAEKAEGVAFLARPAAWALLRNGDAPAACGHAVADGDLLGLFDLTTAPAFRRQGLARRLIAALAGWGGSRGAATAWLQVAVGNGGARALYERMGLREAYRYRYFLRS